jgi:predicted amidohydrolase
LTTVIMKVHAVQLDQVWEDKEANYEKAAQLVADAGVSPGDLIVLPETFPTCFSMNVSLTTADEPGKTEAFLTNLARQHEAWVISGMTIPSDSIEKGRNVSVTFSPEGERIGSYAKTHPAAIYGEHESYDAGDEVIIFPLGGFTACPFICYDLRFPEIFRIGTQKGANLFTVIANWPAVRIEHWITLLRARAIENLAYVVGVNRTGNDPSLEYCGRSIIVDPYGEILADAGEAETVISAELNLSALEEWRKKFPVLEHAREDFAPGS